jgi:hypothetical protein
MAHPGLGSRRFGSRTDNNKSEMRGFFPFDKLRGRMTAFKQQKKA